MEQNNEPTPQGGAPTVTRPLILRGLPTQLFTARKFLLALATVLALSVAYYFVIALPAHNRAMLQLEREKFQATQDEKKLKEIDAEYEKKLKEIDVEHREKTLQIDAEYREKMLQHCLDAAEEDYWDYVKLNGTEVPSKKGVYRAPGYIWENARKKKKEAVDECHRRWDPR